MHDAIIHVLKALICMMLCVCIHVCRSTDGELKMWDLRNGKCLRVYKGHTNVTSFVGLSVCSDFIKSHVYHSYLRCTTHI